MKMQQLQTRLRAHIWSRIRRGELTGQALAREAGFQQAHLSNFLHSRRGLSLEVLDRLLGALSIGVLDLVAPEEFEGRSGLPISVAAQQAVALVSAENATSARFTSEQIVDTISFQKSFLQRLKPNTVGDRSDWERFVLVKTDPASGKAMAPRLNARAVLLVDRFYNSLDPYRHSQVNIYAVRFGAACIIRYVSVAEDRLVLRPHQQDFPVELVRIERGRSFYEYLVGRVCHVSVEI